MAILPITYPPVPEVAIASFEFVDIAEGTGIVTFYGADVETSAGAGIVLLGNVMPAVKGQTAAPAGTTTYNFDLSPFNLPRTVKGTAYFMAALKEGTGAGDTIRLDVQLKKWDGSSETNITSEISSLTVTGAGNTYAWVLFPMATTQTDFKKGDVLRLTVKSVVAGGATAFFSHAPTDRDTTNFTKGAATVPSTVMRIDVPFRID